MPTLLIVYHTPSPSMQAMLAAVLAGARDEAIEGVELVVRPALAATAVDVLAADGYLLGTPANIGYMSGALKHFFDRIYYSVLAASVGRPHALYVHSNSDTTGAVRGVETITSDLRWKRLRDPLTVVGEVDAAALEACWELGGTTAASLMPG
ncbi:MULTISPECIES: flavodoxin family protein [unclassified Pseudofrankia]|uniref:flavodoxin family protein n=1 Tax=unclassified Pseudofrankia TaxID=2994372 RepID=UPI0008D91924|nr:MULTISPECIES: flavodoxin family protein [unclassified Pseudofrankia]MDT3441033.1 flavodoxin family protein [Pseudofrankia sp. BMG5.37]OHV42544.1 flavodoxin [Pseudofrankia sp. BMG5.36]